MKESRSVRLRRALSVVLRGLALAGVGWPIYAMAGALCIYARLGAPPFDWQWYLALVALLVGLAASMIWHLPRSRAGIAVLVGLLAWTVVGYNGFGREMRFDPAHHDPVSISFWGHSGAGEVLREPGLAGGRLFLSVAGRAVRGENGQALIDQVQRLAERDIEVVLAVRASNYLSVPVHEEWIESVRQAAALVEREGLANVVGIIGDAEFPTQVPLDVAGADREAFDQAVQRLAGLIQWMQDEHPDLDLGVTAFWPLYLDHVDGDADLSVVARCAVDPPGGWGFVSAMVYSSYFAPPSQGYYVTLVERMMGRLYPDVEQSHLIGLAAQGMPGEPLLSYERLVRDARLSRAVGVREVVVYKLNRSVLERFGDDFVRRFAADVNGAGSVVEVPFSRPVSLLLYGGIVLDLLLDVKSWRGALLVCWVVMSIIVAYRHNRGSPHEPSVHPQ